MTTPEFLLAARSSSKRPAPSSSSPEAALITKKARPTPTEDALKQSSSSVQSGAAANKSNHTAATKDGEKIKPADPKPKRPLSAYNIFFQHERDRLLRGIDVPAPGGYRYDHDAVHCTLYRDPNRRADRSKKSRPPPHGKIGFAQLAKIIGARWKALDEVGREHYDTLAEAEKERYHTAMAEWHKRNPDAGGSSIISNKKSKKSGAAASSPSSSPRAAKKATVQKKGLVVSPSAAAGLPPLPKVPTAGEMLESVLLSQRRQPQQPPQPGSLATGSGSGGDLTLYQTAAADAARQVEGGSLMPNSGTRSLVSAFAMGGYGTPPAIHAFSSTVALQQQQQPSLLQLQPPPSQSSYDEPPKAASSHSHSHSSCSSSSIKKGPMLSPSCLYGVHPDHHPSHCLLEPEPLIRNGLSGKLCFAGGRNVLLERNVPAPPLAGPDNIDTTFDKCDLPAPIPSALLSPSSLLSSAADSKQEGKEKKTPLQGDDAMGPMESDGMWGVDTELLDFLTRAISE